MRRIFALTVTILFGLAAAQTAPQFRSANGQLVMRWKEFSITSMPGGVFRFELSGDVYAAAKSKGLELWAPRVQIDAISTKGKEADSIKAATATGGVRAVQAAKGARTEMTGKTAIYTSSGKAGKMNMTGPVRLTNFVGSKQSLDATGSSLVAELGDINSQQPVRTATLKGPVHIKIHQAPQGKNGPTDLEATGSTMILDYNARPATVTLLGGVHLRGHAGGGTIEGSFARVILTLDDKNQVTKTEGRDR